MALIETEAVESSVSSGREAIRAPEGWELLDAVLRANRTSPQSQPYRENARKKADGLTMNEGVVCRNQRIFVPDDGVLRTLVIKENHSKLNVAHPGRNKSVRLVAERF